MEDKKMRKRQEFIVFLCVVAILVISCYGEVSEANAKILNEGRGISKISYISNTTEVSYQKGENEKDAVITSGAIKETVEPSVVTPAPTQKPVITKIYFAKKTISLWPKESMYNPPTILESEASYQKISWLVDNKNYATVNKKGEVTLKAKGAGQKVKVTATVYYTEKKVVKTLSASYTLCGKQPVKKLKVSSKKDYLLVGKKYKISAVCTPENATKKTVTWSSNNKTYATISKNGKVQVKSAGTGKTVTFTAKTTDGSKLKKSITLRILDKKKPMIALTFDDGPSIAYTTRIVNQLEKYNARATFFVLGVQLQSKEAKKLVAKSAKYGNEIASHTYSHKNLATLSVADIRKESLDTENLIYKITGKTPALTRPPYGSINNNVKSTITTPLILWSIDTRDWQTRNSSMTISRVLNEVHDGDIVLMHDIYDATATAAETLIPQLVNKGYQLVTVSELAELKSVKLQRGNTYHSMK